MKFFEEPQRSHYVRSVDLPERDTRGFPLKLPELKRPTDSKTGESGVYVGIKGTCVYHSQTERVALHFADFNTNVMAIRTHLPFYDTERFVKLYEAGLPIWANFAATIDIDIVHSPDGGATLFQHGVSCKDQLDEFAKPEVVRRAKREEDFYRSIFGSWEGVTKGYFPEIEYDNYEYILINIRRSDVFGLSEDAAAVACFLKRRGMTRPVNELLGPIARKLGFDESHVFRLACVAIYLGYLRIDHRFQFTRDAPIRLVLDEVYRFVNEPEPAPWGF